MPKKIVPQATQAAANDEALRHDPQATAEAILYARAGAAQTAFQTPAQLQIVLTEIAAAAASIKRLAILLTHDPDADHRDVEAQRFAIETLAQRIGLLADWSAASPERGRGVEDWFLPPAWHAQATKNAEATNG